MAIVNQVEKRVRMNTWQVVKYQILTHCYLYDIPVSEADLNCLTLLAIEGDQELTSFCNKAHEQKNESKREHNPDMESQGSDS